MHASVQERPEGAESLLGQESGGVGCGAAGRQDPGGPGRRLQGQPRSALSWKAGSTPSALGRCGPTLRLFSQPGASLTPIGQNAFQLHQTEG